MWDKLRAKFMGKQETRVLVVGLDGAGKSTIVQRLKYGQTMDDSEVIPTIGFNIECVEYKKMIFSLWDLGGAKETRSFWRFYYEGSQAIIFVFDSTSDAQRVEEAREDLHRLLTEHELWDAPLLIMANKQDASGAMASREITEKLQLYSLANRNWYIVDTKAQHPDVKEANLHAGLAAQPSRRERRGQSHSARPHAPPPPSTVAAGHRAPRDHPACRRAPITGRQDWLYETLSTPAAQRQERARLEHRERQKAHGKADKKAAG